MLVKKELKEKEHIIIIFGSLDVRAGNGRTQWILLHIIYNHVCEMGTSESGVWGGF